jgi:chloramphenicol-sensitive protein RarD
MKTGTSPRAGALAAVTAFLMWGLFPLYWKMLAAVPALEVVAHRTAWGFAAVAAWVTLRGGWKDVRAVARRPRTLLLLAGSAVLIGLNWLLYIWAVAHDHIVEASLGYYVNPLVNVLLGVAVLRERLGRAQQIAVALAAAGVAVLTLGHGRLPWIALALAVSFGLYGLVRKTVGTDAVTGLLWETAILTPAALGFLVALGPRGAFGHGGASTSALLALGGAVTAVPLVLFALGARALPLSTIGLIQYLSPSVQFLLAVLLYREPFTRTHAAAFLCIWAALALLTWDLRRRLRHERAAARRGPGIGRDGAASPRPPRDPVASAERPG